MRRFRVLSFLGLLVAALMNATPALAHAHFVTSTPASGAHLASVPSSISITYDDVLDPNATTIAVLGPTGKNVTTGKTVVTIEATKVATVAISGASGGAYTVKWHAVADDDKGVTEGSFTFTVAAAVATGAATTATTTAVATTAVTNAATAAATVATQPALPTSGGGGMAMHDEALLAGLLLAALLAVAMGIQVALILARVQR